MTVFVATAFNLRNNKEVGGMIVSLQMKVDIVLEHKLEFARRVFTGPSN